MLLFFFQRGALLPGQQHSDELEAQAGKPIPVRLSPQLKSLKFSFSLTVPK